jgi:hypothetical protein
LLPADPKSGQLWEFRNEQGELILLKPTPSGCEEFSRAKLLLAIEYDG